MRPEEEVRLEGMLAVFAEAGRRRDIGRLDFGKRLGQWVELMRGEEGVDGVGPGANVAEEGVAVVADGRGEDKLVVAALGAEGGVEFLRER